MTDLEFEQSVARTRVRRAAAAQAAAYERQMHAACGDAYLRHSEKASRSPFEKLFYELVCGGFSAEAAVRHCNSLGLYE